MLLIETKWYSFFKLSAFTSVFWSPVEDLFYSARHRLRIQHIFTVGTTMNILVLLQVLNDTNKSLNSLLQLMCSDLHLHSCRQSLPMRTTSEFDRARCAWALWIVLVKCSPKDKSFIKFVAKISAVSHNSQLSIEMNGSHPHFSWHGCSSAAEVSVVLPEWKPKTSAKTTTTGPSAQEGLSPLLVTTVICTFWNENRTEVPMLVSKARIPRWVWNLKLSRPEHGYSSFLLTDSSSLPMKEYSEVCIAVLKNVRNLSSSHG